MKAAVLFLTFLPCPILACIWDSDTIQDELATRVGLFDLITGQFPEHGPSYYEHRRKASLEILMREPGDVAARTDLAVALMQLGRIEEAGAELDRLEAEAPGRYETVSNRGVLHQRKGEFKEAAECIEKALALKPGGHPGVGDYYLLMLRHRQASANGNSPGTTFLGAPYSDGAYGSLKDLDHNRLVALLRADRTFADGMLVLGDSLRRSSNLNLALWAYLRALELGHPQPDQVRARIQEIFKHWDQAISQSKSPWPKTLEDPLRTVEYIERDLKQAANWVKRFQQVEEELLQEGRPAGIDAVVAELTRRGISKLRPEAHGLRYGLAGLLSHPSQFAVWFLGTLLLNAFLVFFWWRSYRRRRSQRPEP